MQEKKLYYICAAREGNILASHCPNASMKLRTTYESCMEDILPKLQRGTYSLPYDSLEYSVKNDGKNNVAYIILVEKGYYRPRAFECLARFKQDFEHFFDDRQIFQARPGSLSAEFSGPFDRIFAEFSKQTVDKIAIVNDLNTKNKQALQENLEKLNERDNKIDELSDKVDSLTDMTQTFSTKSHKIKRNAFWGSIQTKLIVISVMVVFLYILSAYFCGWNYSKCF